MAARGRRSRMTGVQGLLAGAQRALFEALKKPLPRYTVALAIFGLALALRLAIFPLDAGYPFFTFYPAVTLIALLCGSGPTLLAIVLSSLVADLLLIPPAWHWSLTYEALASISVFAVSATLISLMIQKSRQGEAQRSLLAAIIRSSDVAVMSKTLQGMVTSWNPEAERLFGYSAAEAIGQPMAMIYPPERLGEEAELLGRIGRGENVTRYETVRIRKDGTPIDVSVTLSPILDRFGQVIGASKIAHDITQRKALEDGLAESNLHLTAAMAELRRSNRELDEFAYIASHDLKEPLRGIHNYASFLEEDYADRLGEEGRSYLDRIKRLAQRMTALIETLLNYSRLGNAPLPMEAVDLDAVLDGVAEDVKPTLSALGAELRRAGRLPRVEGNALRLSEVLQNLIVNAAKYNDKAEKWVEVGCDASGAIPVFYVRDNGIGIAAQHLDRVFHIFKRLHERSKFGGGTGAGLTIVRKIVERHGGRIWLESVEGQGTTVYFCLEASR